MRPSTLQSRLIDTYGTLCDETGLTRLPFAEARQLSIDTLRHLIAWRQHVKKHADDECPPPFVADPPAGWTEFAKRGPKVEETTERRAPNVIHRSNRTGLTERQARARRRAIDEARCESIVDDYCNQ